VLYGYKNYLNDSLIPLFMLYQKTLKEPILLGGMGYFGGEQFGLNIRPAPVNTGRVFETTRGFVPIRPECLRTPKYGRISSRLSQDRTVHGLRRRGLLPYFDSSSRTLTFSYKGNEVICSEHVLATLRAYDVDNAVIEVRRKPSRGFRTMDEYGLATRVMVVPPLPELQKTLCDAIEETGMEEQDAPARIIRLKEEIVTERERLRFVPLDTDDVIITAITDYPHIGRQELTIHLNPAEYRRISTARRYAQQHIPLPRKIQDLILSFFIFPHYGLSHGFSKDNLFLPVNSEEGWKAQERFEAEIAGHSIADRIGGVVAPLPGRLAGVHITCKFSNHQHDAETIQDIWLERERYLAFE